MKKVAQYDLKTGKRIAVYVSISAAAASVYHGDCGAISRACRGYFAQAYGYRWRFVRVNARGNYVVVPPEYRRIIADAPMEGRKKEE